MLDARIVAARISFPSVDFIVYLGIYMKEKYVYPAILAVLSFFTRFTFLSSPDQVVFDETHYGKFVSGYLTHTHFFDLHPPLSKLLAALAAYWGSFDPHFDFGRIGEAFTDPHFVYLRIVPAVCGFLLPLVVYSLAREIGISKIAAFFAGIVVVFENSLLVQSKFLLIDGQLIFFGFAGLLFYLRFRNRKSFRQLLASSLFLGAAISTKWTGASFLATALLIEACSLVHEKKIARLKNFAVLLLVPFLFYVGTFAVHFRLLSGPGTGDAFMSPGFLKKGFTEKFIELNEVMFTQNRNLAATHPYESRWYTWPLMIRPIFYWQGGEQKIYSIGNPFVYWLAFAAILALLAQTIARTRLWKTRRHAALFILFGYCINFLPFMLLSRITFLYYYLAALVFAILAMALLVDSIRHVKIKIGAIVILLILCISGFLYFSPFTYGFPLSPASQQSHFWLATWQ